jgi:peptidoglycan/LPS O-acetylase OafA/YrhL
MRLLAMLAVAAQHGLTVTGHYDWTRVTLSGVTIGQFGVAIFCALSGWFALDGAVPAGRWLWRRLARLYPAFWLATLFAFGLALLLHRPVTIYLFLSQMAGTGFFTHGWDLVNVVSWFISLILLCYFLAAIARSTLFPGLVMAIVAALAVLLVVSGMEIALSRHVLCFAIAAAVKRTGRPLLLVPAGALFIPMLWWQPSFLYAVVAFPALSAAQSWRAAPPRLVARCAALCYEFFLLHGLFLAGAARIIQSAPLAIFLGLAATVPAALALYHSTQWLRRRSSTILWLSFVSTARESSGKVDPIAAIGQCYHPRFQCGGDDRPVPRQRLGADQAAGGDHRRR